MQISPEEGASSAKTNNLARASSLDETWLLGGASSSPASSSRRASVPKDKLLLQRWRDAQRKAALAAALSGARDPGVMARD